MPDVTDSHLYSTWETTPVRWGDMDAFGHINHATYFTYLETARMQYFIKIDLDRYGQNHEFGPVVASATCNFRRQVRFPATLQVGVRTSEVRTRSFMLEYVVLQLVGEQFEVVADGTTAVVWINITTGKAVALPEELQQAIHHLEAQRTGPVSTET